MTKRVFGLILFCVMGSMSVPLLGMYDVMPLATTNRGDKVLLKGINNEYGPLVSIDFDFNKNPTQDLKMDSQNNTPHFGEASRYSELLHKYLKVNIPLHWFFYNDLKNAVQTGQATIQEGSNTYKIDLKRLTPIFAVPIMSGAGPSDIPEIEDAEPNTKILNAWKANIDKNDPTFTLASCNVLYQSYYVGFHAINLKKFPGFPKKETLSQRENNVISLAWRDQQFDAAFRKEHEFKDANILCLQEWPYSDPEQAFNAKSLFQTIPENYDFFRISLARPGRDGVCMFYNGFPMERLTDVQLGEGKDPRYKFKTKYEKNKGVLFANLTLKDDIKVTIISGHFYGSFNDVVTKDFKDQLEIIQEFSENSANVSSKVVICGDFNSNNVDLIKKYFPDNKGWQEVHNWDIKKCTHRSGYDSKDEKENDEQKKHSDRFVRYDFMIYKDLQLTAPATIDPKTNDQLISHTVDQSANPPEFFSDHAVLRGKFGLIMIPVVYDPSKNNMVLLFEKNSAGKGVIVDRKKMFADLAPIGDPILAKPDKKHPTAVLVQEVAYDEEKMAQMMSVSMDDFAFISVKTTRLDDVIKSTLGDGANLTEALESILFQRFNDQLQKLKKEGKKITAHTEQGGGVDKTLWYFEKQTPALKFNERHVLVGVYLENTNGEIKGSKIYLSLETKKLFFEKKDDSALRGRCRELMRTLDIPSQQQISTISTAPAGPTDPLLQSLQTLKSKLANLSMALTKLTKKSDVFEEVGWVLSN